jgi:LacI family transcriptional regulator
MANVTPSTVTHALNGKRPVADKTRGRIMSAIQKLDYIPNYGASHIRGKGSGIIGCYVLDITEGFTSKIVKGIERGLAGSGLSLLFVSAYEFGNDFEAAWNFIRKYTIEGLLICHHIPGFFRPIEQLKDSPIPVVSINMDLEGVKSIVTDNFSGGMIAADHLYASGMRRPAMLAGPETRLSTIRRLAGFKKRLEAIGLPLDERHILCGPYTASHGAEGISELLERDPAIDGVFCGNDYIASGVITRLLATGRKVPDDIRILGYDNRDFSGFWPVPISTFAIPLENMGFLGLGALRALMGAKQKDREHVVAQPKILPRTSTIGAEQYAALGEQVQDGPPSG